MFKRLLILLLAANILPARAAEELPLELQEFEAFADILPSNDSSISSSSRRSTKQKKIIPAITSAIPEAAAYNISNAEQIFCYHVAKRPANFTGYTLDSFAIAGYCGELDAGQTITTYEALFTQSPNIITARANCHIEPRVMLRFVRGVDYTDVLLSSPCPSFTVFYGGKYKAFNIKKGIIDDIISQFEKTKTNFNSPSLLKQTVANGAASTDKEIDALQKKERENEPVMSWKQQQESKAENAASSAVSAKPKGWGNIKLRM